MTQICGRARLRWEVIGDSLPVGLKLVRLSMERRVRQTGGSVPSVLAIP
jgi:hypothetical protein